MTLKERFNKSDSWQQRAALITFYYKSESLTVREVAKYFEMSIGYVSESLLLTARMHDVIDMPTREKALNKLRAKSGSVTVGNGL